MIDTSIKGIQEAQAAVLQAAAAVRPSGGLGKATRYVTLAAHRFAVQNTVVDTGAWRAAQRPQIDGVHGRVFVDPSAVNPKGRGRPAVYGPALELTRGGRYAVYKKTVEVAGPEILAQAGKLIQDALP